MLEAFRMGEDLHCRTASVLLGREITKADKDERSLAKAVNFGLLYGQKGPGLKEFARNAFDVDMTEAEANGFYDKFFHEYKGLAAWHAKAKSDASDSTVKPGLLIDLAAVNIHEFSVYGDMPALARHLSRTHGFD